MLRLGTIALLAGCAAYAARAPLLRWMGGQLVHEDALVRADGVIVLAGDTPAREIAAADMFRDGWAPQVILTVEPPRRALDSLRRRGVRAPAEIDERVRYLTELGVPRGAIIILPGTVESSQAEAAAADEWARSARARTLLVVTSRYHTARARFVFRRQLERSGVNVIMRSAAEYEFTPNGWWRSRTMLRNGLFEWQKLVYYRVRYCCS